MRRFLKILVQYTQCWTKKISAESQVRGGPHMYLAVRVGLVQSLLKRHTRTMRIEPRSLHNDQFNVRLGLVFANSRKFDYLVSRRAPMQALV